MCWYEFLLFFRRLEIPCSTWYQKSYEKFDEEIQRTQVNCAERPAVAKSIFTLAGSGDSDGQRPVCRAMSFQSNVFVQNVANIKGHQRVGRIRKRTGRNTQSNVNRTGSSSRWRDRRRQIIARHCCHSIRFGCRWWCRRTARKWIRRLLCWCPFCVFTR